MELVGEILQVGTRFRRLQSDMALNSAIKDLLAGSRTLGGWSGVQRSAFARVRQEYLSYSNIGYQIGQFPVALIGIVRKPSQNLPFWTRINIGLSASAALR